MNDELGLKIKHIADMLNQDTLPDNLKDIISLFAGSGQKGIDSPNSQKKQPQNNYSNNGDARVNNTEELSENLEMLKTVKNIMGRLNSKSDPRVNLLNALRPFLNNNRQKKIGSCIMFLQVTSLLETMRDLENNN